MLALSALGLVVVGLFLALAWNHDRLGVWGRTLILPLGLGVALLAAAVVRLVRRRSPASTTDHPTDAEPLDPEVLAQAAEAQSARAREFIDKIRDADRRDKLKGELDQLDGARRQPPAELGVVVFGTVSAGKTSLINALVGRHVGETGAVMGTTRHGENHVYTIQSVDGTVHLTDTPGISEAGAGGADREHEARRLAARADLLLFVVDHDLIRGEYAPLIELVRLGKRSIVVLNKKDRFPEADLAAILAKLRERLDGVAPAEDVVAVAAAPRPIALRTVLPDGGHETVYEVQEPDIQALRDRIAGVLAREGPLLRAANFLVKTKLLSDEAESGVARERLQRADEVVDHCQWVTAATVFANPIPALNLVAGAAVQLDMIADLARIYGLEPSTSQLRALAGRMVQAMLKVGLIEAAASVIAGIFKRTPLTFAAAGALQAVTMAYLVRIAGKALTEYYRNGESWGEEGIEAAILRQFELNSRSDFLQDFARQAVDRFLRKVHLKAAKVAGRSGA
ncbi:GTPase Era [Paludisphaera borealis]|uniref:GTPase Era n=1 Tax=Paludisphaera borealis TaxID=1387353 RepID=A0A1U7CYT7_9BACT|nr:GTPase Era [Paludisphaera borealis]